MSPWHEMFIAAFSCGMFIGILGTLLLQLVSGERRAPECRVTIVTDDEGNCIAVTRTDADHKILEVIWVRTRP